MVIALPGYFEIARNMKAANVAGEEFDQEAVLAEIDQAILNLGRYRSDVADLRSLIDVHQVVPELDARHAAAIFL